MDFYDEHFIFANLEMFTPADSTGEKIKFMSWLQ